MVIKFIKFKIPNGMDIGFRYNTFHASEVFFTIFGD